MTGWFTGTADRPPDISPEWYGRGEKVRPLKLDERHSTEAGTRRRPISWTPAGDSQPCTLHRSVESGKVAVPFGLPPEETS